MLRSNQRVRATILTLAIITSAVITSHAAVAQDAADPDASWRLLADVEIKEIINGDLWRAEKTFPDALRAATDGFEITGFFVPITAQAYVETFLLVENPADCPFCGGGGYGPVVEVRMRHPLPDMPEFSLLRLRGDLVLIDDPETFQLYRLEDAVRLDES